MAETLVIFLLSTIGVAGAIALVGVVLFGEFFDI